MRKGIEYIGNINEMISCVDEMIKRKRDRCNNKITDSLFLRL